MNRPIKILFASLPLLMIPLAGFSATYDLRTAIETGLRNNEELRTAFEKLKAAESGKAVTRSAFFPTIEAKGGYTYMGIVPEATMSEMGYTPMPTATDPYRHTHTIQSYDIQLARQNNYTASVSLVQPIFMWGRLMNAYNLSWIQYEMEQENYKKTKLKVISDIKASFYRTLLSKETAKLMEESYNQLKENARSAEVNYNSGLITKYDFMAIKIQMANLEPSVLSAKNNVELAKESLKNTLGLKNTDFDIAGDFKYEKVNYDLNKLQEDVLKNNPDLRIMEMQKKLMEKQVSLIRAANKPSLVGLLNYQYTYIPANSQTFGGNNPNSWTAGIALSVPISEWFPWSRTMNSIEQAKTYYNQAELGLSQLKAALLLLLKQNFLQLDTQYKLIDSQKQNQDNARETYLFRQKQYRDGLIKYTELIDAQVALTRAETNYFDAILLYILAKTNLDMLTGKENHEEF